MRILLAISLIFCLFIGLSFSQQSNGGEVKKATPKSEELTRAEKRQEQAQLNRQRAYVNVIQVDLSDCSKVVAAAAELQKADQFLAFSEERLAELKKKGTP